MALWTKSDMQHNLWMSNIIWKCQSPSKSEIFVYFFAKYEIWISKKNISSPKSQQSQIGSILTMLMHNILVGNQQILNDDILQHKQIAKKYQWTFLKYTPWVSENHWNTNTDTHNHANHYKIYLNPFFVSFLYFIHWCFQFFNIWHIM